MNPNATKALANHYGRLLHVIRRSSVGGDATCTLALSVHGSMTTAGFSPSSSLRNHLMHLYSKSNNLPYARHLFDQIPLPNAFATSTLLSGYSSSGDLPAAARLFFSTPIPLRDTALYNAMMSAFTRNHSASEALSLFSTMRRHHFSPDEISFMCVLSALASHATVESHVYFSCARSPSVLPSVVSSARRLFNEIADKDDVTWTIAISGYLKNHQLREASGIFGMMSEKTMSAWNAMIAGYVHTGSHGDALRLFIQMIDARVELDEYTLTSVITACAGGKYFQYGKEIHAHVVRNSMHALLPLSNSLVTLYWKCGRPNAARAVFDNMKEKDPVSWNAVLSGYISDERLKSAKKFFDEMPVKNYLSWSIIISGMAQNGHGEEGLKLFNQMKMLSIAPCDFSLAGALTSCAVLGTLANGQQVHSQLIRSGYLRSLSACNAMITMYSRCGSVSDARRVFDSMPDLDHVSWNAIIAALGQHGNGSGAVFFFEKMRRVGILPDRVSFLTILSSCSYAGLVDEGKKYFTMMKSYGIDPGEDHYARVVDLLCRAGRFSEAMDLIEETKPGAAVWEAVLAGCRIHGNIDLAIESSRKVFELTPLHDGAYIAMSNMYADAGRWSEMAEVRKLMRDRGVKKEPGCSWLEVDGKIHVFMVDDRAHMESVAIYAYLEELETEIRRLGYVPETRRRMETEKSAHSERLAVAYGLMKLPVGAAVRIMKNLRICLDCHNALKYITKAVGREIVVRDGKRFHHFSGGVCSCNDYW